MNVTKTDVTEALKTGVKLVGRLAMDVYGESLNQTGEQAFTDAIEIGIENTIAALYEAKVNDNEILRVVNLHWGIDMKEAEERLIWEKQQATIRALYQYLRLQGYSKVDMDKYMQEHRGIVRIKHEGNLWNLKDNPEKLFKIIGTDD